MWKNSCIRRSLTTDPLSSLYHLQKCFRFTGPLYLFLFFNVCSVFIIILPSLCRSVFEHFFSSLASYLTFLSKLKMPYLFFQLFCVFTSFKKFYFVCFLFFPYWICLCCWIRIFARIIWEKKYLSSHWQNSIRLTPLSLGVTSSFANFSTYS